MKKIVFLIVWLVALGAFADLGGFLKSVDSITKGAGNVKKVGQGFTGISLKDEQAIGGAVAVEIVANYGGIVRDEAITKRVNLIGKSLAYYSARPELTYRFGVLNSDTINAFSAPGGYIFITRGLYDTLENDDELAGALAHEISHITERHALKIIEGQQRREGVVGLAGQLGDSDVKQVVAVLKSNVGQITTKLFTTGYDRGQEYDADRIGSQLAATVGYAPDGLKQCLEELQKKQSSSKVTIFATHPPLKERIARLK